MADKPSHPGAFDDIQDADTIAPPRREPPTTPPMLFGTDDDDTRVGPYQVFKVLADAPGAKMLEARDAAGQQRLLQIAHVRAPRGNETTRNQLEYIKLIAERTKEIQGDPEVRVLAHGAVERSDGSQLLFWTLPWRDGATRLGHAAAHVQSLAHLCSVAISLVERTRERHEKSRFDPLLGEDLVIIRPGAGASVAGVPLHLPPEWLADDMIRARYAPEEMLRHEPVKSGDLWRLGLTLRGIAKEMGELPSSLRRVFDALADPDPALRMSSAAEASTELRKLQGQFQATERESDNAPRAATEIAAPESITSMNDSDNTWPEGKMVAVNPKIHEAPLASMRPVLSADTGMMKSPLPASGADAQTLIDMRPPNTVRARAQNNLEAVRKKVAALSPDADPNDTLIDVGPPAMKKFSGAKIDDIGRAKMPFGQSGMVTLHSLKLQFLDPVEMVQTVEDPAVAPKRSSGAPQSKTAWDKAKARADALNAGFEIKGPMMAGPSGTLVGLRRIGPAGTVVGAKPRAKELLAKAAADLHGGQRALPARAHGHSQDPGYGGQGYSGQQYSGQPHSGQGYGAQPYSLQQPGDPRFGPQYDPRYPHDPGYPANDPRAVNDLRSPQYAPGYDPRAGYDPNAGYDPRSAGYDPRSAGYDPRNAGYDPRNAGYDPRTANDPRNAGYDPRSANDPRNAYDPRTGYDPRSANAAYDPRSAGYDPRSADAGYDPRNANAAYDPRSAGYDPRSANAGYDPREPRSANDPRGYDPRSAHEARIPQGGYEPSQPDGQFDPRRALPPGPSTRPLPSALVPAPVSPLEFNDGENRPPTVVGVPSLRFRGQGGTEDAQLLESGQARDPASAATARAKPAKPPRKAGRLAIQALLIAAISGALTFAAVKLLPRLREEPTAKITREITALGDVALETMPRESIVVTEDDGRVLGKTPINFLVPPNTAIPVLITAPGHEPQRLLLPARGRVNVTLLPLDEQNATPCEVELRPPNNVRLEAVAGDAQLGPRAKIPGAALVRGADGGGAWIVLCPSLGGPVSQVLQEHIAARPVEIDLLEPSPANAYVDGELIGKVPVKKQTRSGFKVVRVELEDASVERWVPIFADTILRMPAPKK